MPRQRVLVVDDDPDVPGTVHRALTRAGMDTYTAGSGEEAAGMLAELTPAVVATDLRMPGMDGLALLELIRSNVPLTALILMTGYWDLDVTQRAEEYGAEVFSKPLELDALEQRIRSLLRDRRGPRRWSGDSRTRAAHAPQAPMIGHDPALLDVFKQIVRIAKSDARVLVTGETGTGKELVARAIHDCSARASKPFLPLNCTSVNSTTLASELFGHVRGAFTDARSSRAGLLSAASEGTLFLDEIGDACLDFQARLLRVLQDGSYFPLGSDEPCHTNARFILATHRDLDERIEQGEFREDLYHRINVVEINVPPLRERRGDIIEIAEHFLDRAARANGIEPPRLARDAVEALEDYSWPGNVRELEHCLSRVVALSRSGLLAATDLGLDGRASSVLWRPRTLEEVEATHVAEALKHSRGNKSHTARILGVSRSRLDRLIARHKLGQQKPEL